MIFIQQNFYTRLKEFETIFSLLEKIEKDKIKIENDIKISTELKAMLLLILYNAIESSFTNALKKVHGVIIEEKIQYPMLNKDLQHLLIRYNTNVLQKKTIHNSIGEICDLLEIVQGGKFFYIDFKKMTQYYKLYSGNLDAKEIRTVLKKYGIDITQKCESLQKIKNARNQLAHGEISFEECGRQYSSQELHQLKENTERFMDIIFEEIYLYIHKKLYISKKKKVQTCPRFPICHEESLLALFAEEPRPLPACKI